jgi:hypothetical protein
MSQIKESRLSIPKRENKLVLNTGGLIMGLDMYLTAEKYIYGDDISVKVGLKNAGFNSNNKNVRSISVDIMQWRKANQIHQWFVDNVQDGEDDCKRYFVRIEQLGLLICLCKKILKDHSLADQLLHTQTGFFFGSQEYDDMYFLDLQETVDLLEPIIQDEEWLDWEFYYQSSW